MSNRLSLSGLAALALLIGLASTRPAQAVAVNAPLYIGSSVSALSSSAVTSVTVAAPAGLFAGDFMIAMVAAHSTGIAGTAPSGWTLVQGNNSTALTEAVYYRIATSSDVAGSTTYTWALSASTVAAGTILAFSGVSAGAPIAVSGIQTNAASVYFTAPAITYSTNTTWVGLYAIGNGTTAASGPSITTPYYSTNAVDASTQGGTGGVLLGAFYEWMQTAGSACCTSAWIGQSNTSTSAISVGVSVALNGATPAPGTLYHLDEAAWTGAAGQVADSSGNAYNAVAGANTTTSDTSPAISGSPGTCSYGTFAGAQYILTPSTLHVGSTFTATAWIYPTASGATTGGGRIIADDQNGDGWALSFGDAGGTAVRFYARTPTAVSVDSTSLSLNTWYFVVGIMDSVNAQTMTLLVYSSTGTLLNTVTAADTSFSHGTGTFGALGTVAGGGHYFVGNIDEVTVYGGAMAVAQATALALAAHTCPLVPNHYKVADAGTAVNCAPTPVTLYAHTSTHAVMTTVDTIVLGTSTGHGDWTLTTGSGTFTAGASNSGAATYVFTDTDAGTAVFALRDTYAETVTINVTDGSVTATSGSASNEDPPLTFVASGFIITNGSNLATSIGTQQAGVTSTQSLALQAVRTDTNTGACTSVFASGTTVSIGLAYQCNNPTTCVAGQTFKLTNNGTATALASNPNAALATYTTVPLKFSTAYAEAPFTLDYSDAGQISLDAKFTIPLGSGASSGSTMLGAALFVVKPYTLQLSGIKTTSSSLANPAASTASGTVFLGAGQPFTATVTALNALSAATPNFGRETAPATVTMSTNAVLSAAVGGSDFPAISGTFGSYTSGAASGTAFAWPEVGIMTITPSVAGYLGSGTVTGTTTGNVGRFIPNNFATAVNTPLFGTACSAGGFSYVGQPFTYTTAPVITVTAQALGGTTTLNYIGSLFRLTNGSLTSRTYTPTPASPALITTGLPATASDPTIVSAGLGLGTLTFSAGTGVFFARGTPLAPFSANIDLSINVIDLDSVAATTNPVTFQGTGSGILFSTSPIERYGRLALVNALGSELLDLPMALSTQYYYSTTVGFVAHTADVCTLPPAIAFSNYVLPLTTGKTCVRDSGSPGVSSAGCAAAATSLAYDATPVAGAFNLNLAAPGVGYNGAVTVTAAPSSWLQYLWITSSGVNSSPSALATFGLFPGSSKRISQREVY